MDALSTPNKPSRVLRVDSRFRHRAQVVPLDNPAILRPTTQEDKAHKQGGRRTMGKYHRVFHRRAAQVATHIVTVNVEVIVDTNGNLIAQETAVPQTSQQPPIAADDAIPTILVPLPPTSVSSSLRVPSLPPIQALEPSLPSDPFTPPVISLPQLPSVPSLPTPAIPHFPSVPAVPPFPSNLVVPTVPAYPFSSGVAVAQVVASTGPVVPQALATSLAVGSGTTAPATASASTINNLATPTSTVSLLASVSILSTDSLSTARSLSASQTLGTPSRLSASKSSSGASARASDVAGTTYYGDGSAENAATPAIPPAATTAAIADGDRENTPAPLETPQVVGSVVGSLAGAALILAIILLLLRRHKRRRGGVLQLTGDDHTDHVQPMQQAPPRISIVPSAFLHRFSAMSRSTAGTSTSGGERSFQRVSGRKLPSAFSEGMTSEQFMRGDTMSESSFYQDDHGVYGGPGLTKDLEKEIGATSLSRDSGPMNFRPSPARTPVIRHPDAAPPFSLDQTHLSPPQSPNPDVSSRGTLGRSLQSADGSRSSRFTENV